MKHARPRQHIRRLKSGKRILINRGINKRIKHMRKYKGDPDLDELYKIKISTKDKKEIEEVTKKISEMINEKYPNEGYPYPQKRKAILKYEYGLDPDKL